MYQTFDWMNESCLNNLNDIYKQYCKGAQPLEKHLRDVFVTGTVDEVLQNFQVGWDLALLYAVLSSDVFSYNWAM